MHKKKFEDYMKYGKDVYRVFKDDKGNKWQIVPQERQIKLANKEVAIDRIREVLVVQGKTHCLQQEALDKIQDIIEDLD